MSTLENTVSMMKSLPETDLLEIQSFTQKLFQQRESEAVDEAVGKFLKPMSREDIIKNIEIAEQEIAAGLFPYIGQLPYYCLYFLIRWAYQTVQDVLLSFA